MPMLPLQVTVCGAADGICVIFCFGETDFSTSMTPGTPGPNSLSSSQALRSSAASNSVVVPFDITVANISVWLQVSGILLLGLMHATCLPLRKFLFLMVSLSLLPQLLLLLLPELRQLTLNTYSLAIRLEDSRSVLRLAGPLI